MEKTRDLRQDEFYQIHYNRPGNLLALDLAQALGRGEVVAVQGDRVLEDVSPVEVPLGDHLWRLPRGPFVLALATRVPVFPLFILRTGWRRYQILVSPPLPPPANPRDREAAVREMAGNWSNTLLEVARRNWWQWFVLEDAFLPQPPSKS